MWGLPDSAVLGTLGRIKHASNKNRKGSAVSEKKEITLAQNWENFIQDSRSFEELLAEAKRHAQEKEKAGKQKKSGKFGIVLLVAKGVTGSRDKVKTQAKFIRRRIAVGVVLLGLFAWANNATTPDECKVPTEQMNQFCLDLLYP